MRSKGGRFGHRGLSAVVYGGALRLVCLHACMYVRLHLYILRMYVRYVL